ncbi:MAG: hypothetical protein ABFD97_01200 [Syntrophobacter sp.]
MARNSLHSCLEKRDLLNQSALSVDKLTEWGARYEEAGQFNDAIDFYERASASGALENLLPLAIAEGDAFLYGRLLRALNREGLPEDWAALGQRADELGKQAYAREAFKKSGRQASDDAPTK